MHTMMSRVLTDASVRNTESLRRMTPVENEFTPWDNV